MSLSISSFVKRGAVVEPYASTAALLDFEQPIIGPLQKELKDLEELHAKKEKKSAYLNDEIALLKQRVDQQLQALYSNLTPWQKVQVARHAERPRFLDFANMLFQDFTPLAGDRYYGEDCAMMGGFAFFNQQPCVLIGQERGKDIASRLKHNFGMPKPEAYRKAIRLMKLADQFSLPVISLVDTPGAFPGVEAEERGQAEAIARNIDVGLNLKVPFVCLIIGEGGSGGAMAIASADRVAMLEHAVYSVISPEGCASILWRDAKKAEVAATAQKITAADMLRFKVIDKIVPEPIGGAHRDPASVFASSQQVLSDLLAEVRKIPAKDLIERRRQKYLAIGMAAS
ncbi:MAG: acetyl-CoA carboxylase carboxyltransferase subunit alpha [Alphaproteobacteria bacterium]|nr:acetyl-CoA carboxylase carboxyltransferase subunit alpha [Alphaproteobacteria bacterium]